MNVRINPRMTNRNEGDFWTKKQRDGFEPKPGIRSDPKVETNEIMSPLYRNSPGRTKDITPIMNAAMPSMMQSRASVILSLNISNYSQGDIGSLSQSEKPGCTIFSGGMYGL
jgi:hypothetical protein